MSLSMVSERKSLRWHYYYIVAVVFLLLATGAFGIVDRLVYGTWAGKAGDKLTQSVNLIMFVTAFLLFWRASRKRILVGGVLALALAGFLVLSAVWSIDPQTTVRRGVIYLFFIIGAIGIAGSLDADEAMDAVCMTCGLCAAASIVLLVISPSNVWSPSGLYGIFPSKNLLGEVMEVGVLASLYGITTRRRHKRLSSIWTLILFIIVAFLSRSTTSMLVIFVFCTLSGVIALFRGGGNARILGVFLSLFLIPTAVFVLLSPDWVLGMTGKDPTLTGRTELWSYVLDDIQKKPILGWGFSAFWSGNNPAVMEISTALGWYITQAHNNLLEMLLEVGIVGTAFFLFLWARNVVLALRCMNTAAKELAQLLLLCSGGILLEGISESVLLETTIWVIMFFTIGLACERAMRAPRRQRRPAALQVPRVEPMHPRETKFRTR
jgi:O-antigen ligase